MTTADQTASSTEVALRVRGDEGGGFAHQPACLVGGEGVPLISSRTGAVDAPFQLTEEPESLFPPEPFRVPGAVAGASLSQLEDGGHAIVDMTGSQKDDSEVRSKASHASRANFREAAKRVIQANRAAKKFSVGLYNHTPGEAQGIIPAKDHPAMQHIKSNCKITCVDYGAEKYRCIDNIGNDGIEALLSKPSPNWAPCRWINVDGFSWDVISRLAQQFQLHPLAVEDLLHVPQRTKMDYYEHHTALYLTVFSVEDSPKFTGSHKADLLSTYRRADSRYIKTHSMIRGSCSIKLEQAAAFMIPSSDDAGNYTGTLITFFEHGGGSVTTPIIARLSSGRKMLLRTSEDISFLLQALVDVIVDHAFSPLRMYSDQISELEGLVLQMPRMKYTRELHLIQGELALLRQCLGPMAHLVNGLREPKVDRLWISPLTITYLGDVKDHSETILENIDTLSTLAKNNVDLIFNTIAYNTNENMRSLSLISIIFLPITFLAGVYGTNFTEFPELNTPLGIWYFWRICIIVAVLTVLAIFFDPVMCRILPSWRRYRLKGFNS